MQGYADARDAALSTNLPQHIISVQPYEGSNKYVLVMKDYLEHNLINDIAGAFVIGSLASGEEVPYSDFDAVAIIRTGVFSSRKRLIRTAEKLSAARSIMYGFDPLQHHGWFVLTEADLDCYPDSLLPHGTFLRAKSLLPGAGTDLNLRVMINQDDNRRHFLKLSSSIITAVSQRNYPDNVYRLKALLSSFMLLPALYIQARDGGGIDKKLSFAEAKKDFPSDAWTVMEEVSGIRAVWQYDISALHQWVLTNTSPFVRSFARRHAPLIPQGLHEVLTETFYGRIKDLALTMEERIR